MADLTVTITEDLTLNSSSVGTSNTKVISSIIDVYKRIVTCPALQTTTVATFADNVYDSAGAIDAQGVKYVRITNLSETYDIELAVVGAATLYQVHITAGNSHMLNRADDCMLSEADTSPSFGTMADLASLQVRPTAGSDVNVDLFIATT